MKQLLFLLSMMSSAFFASAQYPNVPWDLSFGSANVEMSSKLIENSTGGFVLSGTSGSGSTALGNKTDLGNGDYDFWIVNINASGAIIWQNAIGGSNEDIARDIIGVQGGGYLVSGRSNSNVSGEKTTPFYGDYDIWLAKMDGSNGNILWQLNLGGNNYEDVAKVIQTSDGGFLVGGSSDSGITGNKTVPTNGLNDYWLIKLDATGNILWQKTIGGAGQDYLRDLRETADGGFILGGTSSSNISGDKTSPSAGLTDIWLVKINATGTILWDKTITANQTDQLNSIEVVSNGDFLIAATSNSTIGGDKDETTNGGNDIWVIQTDGLGNIVWQETYGGDLNDMAVLAKYNACGNIIVSGNSSSTGAVGDHTTNTYGSQDYWVFEVANTGMPMYWNDNLGGSSLETLTSTLLLADGSMVHLGYSSSDISGYKTSNHIWQSEYWVIKQDPVQQSLFADTDGDGYGDPLAPITLNCANPGSGYVANNQDCNDNDPLIYPQAIDYCGNGLDENCDGYSNDINVTAVVTDAACGGTGSIDLTVTLGTGSYSFNWPGLSNNTIEHRTNLLPGTYCVVVTDFNTQCSFLVCSTVNAVGATQGPVTGVVVTPGTNGTSATVTWVDYPGSNYQVRYRACNGIWAGSINTNGNASHTINSLLPCKCYQVQIRQRPCNGSWQPWTSATTQTFNTSQFLTLASSTTTVSSCCAATGSITFNVVGGTVPYVAEWSWGTTTTHNSNIVSVTNLNAGQYCVTITDQNGCTVTKCVNVNLAPCTPPTGLTLTSNASGSITANWNTVSCATSYQVQLYNSAGALVSTVTTPSISRTFNGLVSGATYKVRIRSRCCNFSWSAWTPQISIIANLQPNDPSMLITTSENLIDMSVFPNPASEYFTIALSGPVKKVEKIQILDITGRVVYTENLNGKVENEYVFDIRTLPAGMYVVQLKTDKALLTTQLIKK